METNQGRKLFSEIRYVTYSAEIYVKNMRIIISSMAKFFSTTLSALGQNFYSRQEYVLQIKDKLRLNLKTSLVVVSPLIYKPALHTSTYPRTQTALKLIVLEY